jgi:hypothetical protein
MGGQAKQSLNVARRHSTSNIKHTKYLQASMTVPVMRCHVARTSVVAPVMPVMVLAPVPAWGCVARCSWVPGVASLMSSQACTSPSSQGQHGYGVYRQMMVRDCCGLIERHASWESARSPPQPCARSSGPWAPRRYLPWLCVPSQKTRSPCQWCCSRRWVLPCQRPCRCRRPALYQRCRQWGAWRGAPGCQESPP